MSASPVVSPNEPRGCPTAVAVQLELLAALRSGWYDASSRPFGADELRWLSELLSRLLRAFELPRPYLYPSPEGIVVGEWAGPSWELAVSFDLERRSATALGVRVDADQHEELRVELREPRAESQLGGFLAAHLSAAAHSSPSTPGAPPG